MAEYLIDIVMVDSWTITLSMAELRTNPQGASERAWAVGEEFCDIDILSLGKGKMGERIS